MGHKRPARRAKGKSVKLSRAVLDTDKKRGQWGYAVVPAKLGQRAASETEPWRLNSERPERFPYASL